MSFIDTYQIASCGQNTLQTCTMATNGILLCIKIEDVIVGPGGSGGYIHGGVTRRKRRDHEERNKVKSDYEKCKEKKARGEECDEEFNEEEITTKKITVVATINNKDYTETRIVEGYPTLEVKDIDVKVTETGDKPKITITVLKK